MLSQNARQSQYLVALLDGLLLTLAFYGALGSRALLDLPQLPALVKVDVSAQMWLLASALPVYFLLASRFRLYSNLVVGRWEWGISRLAKVFAFLMAAVGTVIFLAQAKSTSRAIFFLFVVYGFVLVLIAHSWIRFRARTRHGERPQERRVVIVGTGPDALQIREKITARPGLGLRIIGHLTDTPAAGIPEEISILGAINDYDSALEDRVVDDVIFCLPFGQLPSCEDFILWCEEQGITTHFRSDFFRTIAARTYASELDGTPMLTVSPIPQDALALLVKRVLDIVGSGMGLLLLSPLLALISLAIRLSSPGPVIFGQKRLGLNRRVFTMYKFRSMYSGAERQRADLENHNEASGPVFKIKDDPRVTPVGRWLRKSSLDELPQLWNVLAGEMSLVGPRPPIPDEVRQYERWQKRRLSMRPGITCLWQVSGRNNIAFDEWMRLDLAYIDNWSLKLDFQILLRTIPAVLFARGAH